jgi:hypothetical protein
MTDIKGKTIYMRKADENVLNAFISGHYTGRVKRVSVRDRVFIRMDNSASYVLWDTELVRRLTDRRIWIYITSEHGKDSEYYGNYERRRDPAMTQTTRARLDAFLNYYGFSRLEVHSSKKLFGVWHNGKELENDSWYELDFTSRELVKVN